MWHKDAPNWFRGIKYSAMQLIHYWPSHCQFPAAYTQHHIWLNYNRVSANTIGRDCTDNNQHLHSALRHEGLFLCNCNTRRKDVSEDFIINSFQFRNEYNPYGEISGIYFADLGIIVSSDIKWESVNINESFYEII